MLATAGQRWGGVFIVVVAVIVAVVAVVVAVVVAPVVAIGYGHCFLLLCCGDLLMLLLHFLELIFWYQFSSFFHSLARFCCTLFGEPRSKSREICNFPFLITRRLCVRIGHR